jgi:hypothetical protein
MLTPEGRPVVDVTEFATLARLAESYGLMVLRWSHSQVETFIVQDQGITYRYRTRAGVSHQPMPDPELEPQIALLNRQRGARA